MNDALNAGLPSDRFEAEWWLESNSEFRIQNSELQVEVPRDFQAVKRQDIQAAWRWRTETRERFQQVLADGYVAVDFRFEGERASYVFVRP
jgi:predicted GNAT superfamily acetyltransferase